MGEKGEMTEEIERIIPPELPFKLDEKIFTIYYDDEEQIGEAYSYNDLLKLQNDISGINEELLGKNENTCIN